MRQLGAFLVGAQCLVGLVSILVVVRVALEFETEDIGQAMRCVPRVVDINLLVFTRGDFLALETVMLHIVDNFQSELEHDRIHDEVDCHACPPYIPNRSQDKPLTQLAVEHAVQEKELGRTHLVVLAFESVALDLPTLPKLAICRPQEEGKHGFALPCGGWVEGSGDPLVMAFVMRDLEVRVHKAKIHNIASQLMVPFTTMGELMAD